MKNNINTNKYIKIIPTRKYKDINLYLRFSIENKPKLKEKIALLCKMIGDISNKYPNKVSMAKAKDMLYGIGVIPSYSVRANIITLSIHYSFINPKFVDATINEYNDFILETLYNSIIDEATLSEAKRILVAEVLRKNERPAYEAKQSVNKIISKDNPSFSIYCEDDSFIHNIDDVNIVDIQKTYKNILDSAQLNLYLCGDLKTKDIKVLTNYSFENRKSVKLKHYHMSNNEKKTIVHSKDISQSYLTVVYTSPFNMSSKDYFAWFLGNTLLGTVPTSLLFSEIREKMSLCYSIGSVLYKDEGLIMIHTSIDGKKKNSVIKAIEKQVDRLRNSDYDIKQLEITKALIGNILFGIYDDLDALINYYHGANLTNFKYSLEEYYDNIMKVTPADISRVYKKYHHYFNYVLLGNKHE